MDEILENRLRRFRPVMRRKETEAERAVIRKNVRERRGRGRPEKRRLDTTESDLWAAGGCK